MRLRLHPRDNGCEKNLLFTPQMYEQMEIAALSAQIERAAAKNRNFVFLDIGANVGLFSLFVAAQAGSRARIFAVEPERGNLERLYFNVGANPGVPIRVIPIALSDAPGQVAIQVHSHDRGGTRARRIATEAPQAGEQRIEARTLLQLVKDENIHSIDAMKIDIEGAEDAVLLPFFEQAPVSLWPQLILIEDAGAYWSTDVIAFLTARGYAVAARSKINAVLRRE
jgi:FkbM family methyltransferase